MKQANGLMIFLVGMAFMSASCNSSTQPPAQERPIRDVREPAVAGLFYPKDANVLAPMVDAMLARANPAPLEKLRGLICPHAGYEFSGLTAALAYKLLAGQDIQTVVVLSGSHTALFDGVFVPRVEAYRTPLGLVRLSPQAAKLAQMSPFTSTPQCQVHRPQWIAQSSRTPPPDGQDLPDTWEHSGEVQLPFLQRTLKNFTIVPAVYGNADPAAAARALDAVLDNNTLIVASSDLSHFFTDSQARVLDARCLSAICAMDTETMKTQEACGKGPILTLMYLAKAKGWRVRFLGYSNSADSTGRKDNVVGYGAVAFYEPGKTTAAYTAEERRWMLTLARKTLTEVVTSGKLPLVDSAGLTAKVMESKGCFVTLAKAGQLRGCIGNITAQGPLYSALMANTRSAALHDGRFSPVKPEELGSIQIEISVLTTPDPLYFSSPQDLLDRLQAGRDGVILQIGNRSATYLPQVWEQIPNKEAFLNNLAVKAGCPADAWKTGPVTVHTYQVESMKEGEK